MIFLSNENWESDGCVGSCSFEVDGWCSGDEWGSMNDCGNMSDWGEGEGVLGCDACSRGEGSVLRGELGRCIRFGVSFVVAMFVGVIVNVNNQ